MKNRCLLFFYLLVFTGLSACSDKVHGDNPKQAQADKPRYIQDVMRIGGNGPKMVVIPAGTGFIGDDSSQAKDSETPFHKIVAKHPFAMSTTEITFAEYDRYCKAVGVTCPDDKGWGRGNQPVINVSWSDAEGYARWLTDQTGQTYRLPSEAEWEYAARAGSQGRFWWGNKYIQGKDHCDKDIGGCPKGTALSHPGPVGRFQPNPFGLYDMTSNVEEWTLDCWNPHHDANKTDLTPRLTGDCNSRVIKGGAYYIKASYLRLSARVEGVDYKTARYNSVGFRLVREIETKNK